MWEDRRRIKEAVKEIKAIQRERDIEEEVSQLCNEYDVDEETARLYVIAERKKKKVKEQIQKRNAVLKGIGAAVGAGLKRMGETQKKADTIEKEKKEQNKKEETVSEESVDTPRRKRRIKQNPKSSSAVLSKKGTIRSKEPVINYGEQGKRGGFF